MDYTNMLDSFGGIIEEDLRQQLKHIVKKGMDYHPFLGQTYKILEDYLLRGGRRLASCSTLIVYKGYTGQIDDKIVKAGSGIEFFRHSILVHDDIVDAEMSRRGGKTVHRLLEDGYDERFGIGSATFAGNMLFSLALESILQSGFDDGKLKDVVNLLSADYKAVNESQILDLLFEYTKPSAEDWKVMTSKRASSLFRTSLLTGAILASAPAKDRLLLEEAAKQIGFAFDIQDDIIDTFASEEQYGREPGGDILKRKKPLHVILAMQKERTIESLISGKAAISKEDIPGIRELIRGCGALDEAKSISKAHAKEAQRLIVQTDMSSDTKEFFIALIDYVAESLDWYK